MATEKDKFENALADEGEGQLTVDVYQTPTEIVVQAPIAGIHKDEIDVEATSESVTIRGERKRGEKIEESDYLYQECFWGRFSRSIILPEEVDPDRSKVYFGKNGILTIRLPKVHRGTARKLQIKVEE